VQTAILTLHVIVCVILVVLVLLQSGREGMGVIFGGGGNSVFGNAGAGGILAKLTTFLAVIFICTSLGYNIMTSSTNKTVESVLDVQFEEVPAAPAAAPAPAAPAEVKAPEAPAAEATAPAEAAPAPAAASN
jgi:preprotein translocase subunit SecG